jgi:cholesterol transport system auxiliary component
MMRAPAILAAAVLLSACTPLKPPTDVPSIYVLDTRLAPGPLKAARDAVVAVDLPRARPGFDTAQMAYLRRPHEIEYFAKNRWADTPARMLAPLLVQALEQSGDFRAVVQAPGTTSADLRLQVEIVRLFQDFAARPSRVRFTLRVQVIDAGSRRALATREFDEMETSPSDDAYGGVLAANWALERLLRNVVDFTAEQAARR